MPFPKQAFFDRHREHGALILRLQVGAKHDWGTQDNVLSHERMLEFADFLKANGFPWPLFGAYLSAWTQLLCGILLLFGAAVRWISMPIVINFIAALLIAHRGDSFRGMFPALVILGSGLFFLFHGAGDWSLDRWLERRRQRSATP